MKLLAYLQQINFFIKEVQIFTLRNITIFHNEKLIRKNFII